MKTIRLVTWVLAAAPPVLLALFWGGLPDRVPVHWGLEGAVTYGARWELAVPALLPLLLLVLLRLLPRLDPRRKSYGRFQREYDGFALALTLFLYSGNGMFVNLLAMVLFGMAIGVLICFLGGLMAIDIVPREATGAALGIVGMASYVGAGLQDIVSGWLIDSGKTLVDGVVRYDFGTAALFWIAASALSFILALFVARGSRR